MLEGLIKQLQETPGPLKPARVVVGDLAQELLDLTRHYIKRFQTSLTDDDLAASADLFSVDQDPKKEPPDQVVRQPEVKSLFEPERTLEVSESFANALDFPKNKKNQEFKVLAIFSDAAERSMGSLSAREASNHGKKLGLKIRHENVRKMVRMRLGEYVEILTEERGNGTLNKYRISPPGIDYFFSKYLNKQA
ncbi:MAG: hypothetical protein GY762_16085 [Proteobacteria bacterium]|nr:hypothetical protein [Pseudomonadota bacterium]